MLNVGRIVFVLMKLLTPENRSDKKPVSKLLCEAKTLTALFIHAHESLSTRHNQNYRFWSEQIFSRKERLQ